MTQERYVTSAGIEKLRKKVDEEIKPVLVKARNDMHTTDVGLPGFGALGELVFGWQYRDLQRYSQDVLDQAVDTLTKWNDALATTRDNWHKAEDNSTVLYQ